MFVLFQTEKHLVILFCGGFFRVGVKSLDARSRYFNKPICASRSRALLSIKRIVDDPPYSPVNAALQKNTRWLWIDRTEATVGPGTHCPQSV